MHNSPIKAFTIRRNVIVTVPNKFKFRPPNNCKSARRIKTVRYKTNALCAQTIEFFAHFFGLFWKGEEGGGVQFNFWVWRI